RRYRALRAVRRPGARVRLRQLKGRRRNDAGYRRGGPGHLDRVLPGMGGPYTWPATTRGTGTPVSTATNRHGKPVRRGPGLYLRAITPNGNRLCAQLPRGYGHADRDRDEHGREADRGGRGADRAGDRPLSTVLAPVRPRRRGPLRGSRPWRRARWAGCRSRS